MTESAFIPVNEPLILGNEERYVLEAIRTGWISSEGPAVERFEQAMAARCGRKYAVAVCNGSAALDAAVAALKLGPGDEVILPAFTIISCAASVVRAGATPVLVDVDPKTWNMTVEACAAAITPRTRAIMAVHIYGLPVDMPGLLALAARHGLAVIEDAAEAQGLTCAGRPCGGFGEISCLSFYPNKLVSTGEGGMALTDDPALAGRLRSLRNLCFQPGKRFVHEELGWNLRMSNIQAAFGLGQAERWDESVRLKRRIGARYQELLAGLAGVRLPLPRTANAENIYWVYGLVLEDDIPLDAEGAMARLHAEGIGTRPFFWPMHEQPVFRRLGLFAKDRHPVSERLARRGFYIPSGLGLTAEQAGRAAGAVRGLLGGAS